MLPQSDVQSNREGEGLTNNQQIRQVTHGDSRSRVVCRRNSGKKGLRANWSSGKALGEGWDLTSPWKMVRTKKGRGVGAVWPGRPGRLKQAVGAGQGSNEESPPGRNLQGKHFYSRMFKDFFLIALLP